MTPWSPTNSRTSRTCGGPGWSWPHCTEQPATPPAGSTPAASCSPSTTPTTPGCGCGAPTGPRAVLWGRSALAPPSPPDARRGAPDWALSDATEERRPTFLAWYAHGEWDTNTSCPDEGALHLLRPLLTVDPRVVELGRRGQLTPDDAQGLRQRRAPPGGRPSWSSRPAPTLRRRRCGSVRSRLRDQVHGQMRDADEADRMLMQRPPSLVQWSRVNGPAVPFELRRAGAARPAGTGPHQHPDPGAGGPHPGQRAADPAPRREQRGLRRVAVRAGAAPTACW